MVGMVPDFFVAGHDWTCDQCNDHWISEFYILVGRFL